MISSQFLNPSLFLRLVMNERWLMWINIPFYHEWFCQNFSMDLTRLKSFSNKFRYRNATLLFIWTQFIISRLQHDFTRYSIVIEIALIFIYFNLSNIKESLSINIFTLLKYAVLFLFYFNIYIDSLFDARVFSYNRCFQSNSWKKCLPLYKIDLLDINWFHSKWKLPT